MADIGRITTAIKTTCIGAFPKPDFVPVVDWFNVGGGLFESSAGVTRQYTKNMDNQDEAIGELLLRTTKLAMEEQVSAAQSL